LRSQERAIVCLCAKLDIPYMWAFGLMLIVAGFSIVLRRLG